MPFYYYTNKVCFFLTFLPALINSRNYDSSECSLNRFLSNSRRPSSLILQSSFDIALLFTDKKSAIIANNDIKSVTVVRMEVPCCGGIESDVKRALMASGKFIPWRVVTVSTDGRILD